jgi:hypothetical protein
VQLSGPARPDTAPPRLCCLHCTCAFYDPGYGISRLLLSAVFLFCRFLWQRRSMSALFWYPISTCVVPAAGSTGFRSLTIVSLPVVYLLLTPSRHIVGAIGFIERVHLICVSGYYYVFCPTPITGVSTFLLLAPSRALCSVRRYQDRAFSWFSLL